MSIGDITFSREDIINESNILVRDILRCAKNLIKADPKQKFIYGNPFTADHRSRKRSSKKRETNVPESADYDTKIAPDGNEIVQDEMKHVEIAHDDNAHDQIAHDDIAPDEMKQDEITPVKSPVRGFLGKQNFNIKRYTEVSQKSREQSFIIKNPFDQPNKLSLSASVRSTFESIRRGQEGGEWVESVGKLPEWNFDVDFLENSDNEDSDGPDLTETVLEKLVNFEWITIAEFTIEECSNNIINFINLWKLSPSTKFCLLPTDGDFSNSEWGDQYTVVVQFSKPTVMCPNPLAVAKVYFTVYKSHVLPSFYPINLTYRFEGYKSNYHTQGPEHLRSVTFQMYFIESILNAKMSFYVELFECKNGSIYDKPEELTLEEEMALFDKQQDINTKQYYDTVHIRRKKIKKESLTPPHDPMVAEKVASQAFLNDIIDKYQKRERVLREFGFKEFLSHFQSSETMEDPISKARGNNAFLPKTPANSEENYVPPPPSFT